MNSTVPTRTIPASGLDFTRNQDFTGTVSFSIPLLSLGGASVELKYHSKDIATKVRTENRYAPSSAVGLGWDLVYGSISGEINGTADTSDDRYFFVGPDGSFELRQGDDAEFRIPTYRPWRIERKMSGGLITGWTVTKEDGTILRFGNHAPAEVEQSATRFFLGYDGMVSNPDESYYDELIEIPFQWDLAIVEEQGGRKTSFSYFQVEKPLRAGSTSSATYGKYYTRESRLSEIYDNQGNRIVFNYSPMSSEEYFDSYVSYTQHLYDTLYLNSIQLMGRGQTFKHISFMYASAVDILDNSAAKRYLTGLSLSDMNGNALPSYKFEYYLSGSDSNPGALKSLESPDGGKVVYSYKLQTLENVQLSMEAQVDAVEYYDQAGQPIDEGLAGKDFAVVRSENDSLQVFRINSRGWSRDTTFPVGLSSNMKVANDFIVLYDDINARTVVVRRYVEGWRLFDVDAALVSAGCTLGEQGVYAVSAGANYFVVKHNLSAGWYEESWDISVVSFGPTGLLVHRITEQRYYEGQAMVCDVRQQRYMTAFCADNYFVLMSKHSDGTLFTHFRRAPQPGEWTKLGSTIQTEREFDPIVKAPSRVQTGKNFVVVSYNYGTDCESGVVSSRLAVYRRDGAQAGLALVDSVAWEDVESVDVPSVIVGEDFYAFTYTTGPLHEFPGNRIQIRAWNEETDTFSVALDTTYQGIFGDEDATLTSMRLTAMGNKLIIHGYSAAGIQHTGFIAHSESNGSWTLPGEIMHERSVPYYSTYVWASSAVSLNENTLVEVSRFPSGTGSGDWNVFVLDAFQFQGTHVKRVGIDSILTGHGLASNWIWQPAANSFAIARMGHAGSSGLPEDSVNLYILNNSPNGSLSLRGPGSSSVVAEKIFFPSIGDPEPHRYAFENGVINQFTSAEYSSVTDTLPMNAGTIGTLYHTSKDSIVGGVNLRTLSGMAYQVDENTQEGELTQRTLTSWTSVPVDSINGVFSVQKTSESTTTDGVTRQISFLYGDKTREFVLKQSEETNSDGKIRTTRMSYPLDYEATSGASSDSMVQALDDMKKAKHMYTSIIEKLVTQTTPGDSESVVSAELVKYRRVAEGERVLPSEGLSLRSQEPILFSSFVPSWANSNSFGLDSNYQRMTNIEVYDSIGNIVQSSDAHGIQTSTKWGYGLNVPIARFVNAAERDTHFDDFADKGLQGWVTTDVGSPANTDWSVEKGHLKLVHNSPFSPLEFDRITYDHPIELSGSVVLEFDVRIVDSDTWDLLIGMGGDAWGGYEWSGTEMAVWSAINDETWFYATGSWNSIKSGLVPNNWSHFKIVVDCAAGKVDYYVDGQRCVFQANVRQSTSGIRRVVFGRYGYQASGTTWYIDNVRLYPYSATAFSASYDTTSLHITEIQDANGSMQQFGYDAHTRLTKQFVRTEGRKRLLQESRYHFSRSLGDTFSVGRPNLMESVQYDSAGGFHDFSMSTGWTYSGDITFNVQMAGETTVRMGTQSGAWDYIYRAAGAGHRVARVDCYFDSTTGSVPHILAFDNGSNRFCVQYVSTTQRFRIQTRFNGGSYTTPMSFSLPVSLNTWYTVEIEKTDAGECYAFVFPKGHGRIHETGYVYFSGGYPTGWSPNVRSWSIDDYFFLANHYIGLPGHDQNFTDGLGRGIQQQQQLKGLSLVAQNTVYDSLGRVSRIYKSYEKDFQGTQRHRFDASFHSNDSAYYPADAGYSYAGTEYKADPLNRVSRNGAPGAAFRIGAGHEQSISYSAGVAGEIGGYTANSLLKTRLLDEDAKLSSTFVDNFGNNVATVIDSASMNLATVLEYDVLGNMTKSIPPISDRYSAYSYTTRGELSQKTTPDADTVLYLYDKNGNQRLTRDGAHHGTMNSVNLSNGSVQTPYSTSGSFTLGIRGKVTLSATVIDFDEVSTLTVRVKKNGVVLSSAVTSGWSADTKSIALPSGTYQYEVFTTGQWGYFTYSIQSLTAHVLVYNSYDSFSRVTEIGELESNSTSQFNQANADNPAFPVSGRIISRSFVYDEPSTEALAAGQRNLNGRVSVARSYRLGSLASESYYSYDDLGQVEWVAHSQLGTYWKKIKYWYDLQGRLRKKCYIDLETSTNDLWTFYEYDQAGRLVSVLTHTTDNPSSATREATYSYTPSGQTKQLNLGNSPAQTVDYSYNEREWLTQVNDIDNISGDKFALTLWYNTVGGPYGELNNSVRYNGNISATEYQNVGVSPSYEQRMAYTFAYDNSNRLTGGQSHLYLAPYETIDDYSVPSLSYDDNGNILTLQRRGHDGGMMDNLTYHYSSSNRLNYVDDAVDTGSYTYDLDDQDTLNFQYDANGNVLCDIQRGIAFMVYDIFNQPVTMYKTDGAVNWFTYDVDGQRTRKYNGSAYVNYVRGADGTTEAVGANSGTMPTYNILGNDNLGQIKRNGSTLTRYYYLKDHLGSVRVTVDASGNIVGNDDYYPFGMQMNGRSGVGSADARYRFTGQERDVDIAGDDYFGARYYDARVGRWVSIDPMEEYDSPYIYVGNNPLRWLDILGMQSSDSTQSNMAEMDEVVVWGQNKSHDYTVEQLDFIEGLASVVENLGVYRFDHYHVGGKWYRSTDLRYPAPITGVPPDFVGLKGGLGSIKALLKSLLRKRSLKEVIDLGHLSAKKMGQMAKRGWTKEMVKEAVENGKRIPGINKATGNPATRYVHPRTGQSVVIDDVTKQPIHFGGPGFRYGPSSGDIK